MSWWEIAPIVVGLIAVSLLAAVLLANWITEPIQPPPPHKHPHFRNRR